ncbi:hypothetical protein CPC08DRAFT_798544 [Agrocybe pediades]|nr:hypothetical protein CPC08DRAFT_798544 [Agrocybe pediades]
MGRTLTHEVGHWSGLFHAADAMMGVGDNIADTPPQASGSDGCPKGRDSCPGDEPHLIDNYSYDSCVDSFTRSQAVGIRESAKAFGRPERKVALPEKRASTTSVSVYAMASTDTATVWVAACSTAFSTTTTISGISTTTVASSVASTSTIQHLLPMRAVPVRPVQPPPVSPPLPVPWILPRFRRHLLLSNRGLSMYACYLMSCN